jgi:A/G-specific adenine glycosylase
LRLFTAPLIAWQREHGRHTLPWQQTTDPYRVWLSEIMLQQTQVSTVLGYYDRFLTRFPTVADLAAASQDDVMALWSGLGYYSRARNMHACAKAVVSEFGGAFPRSSALLQTLPGIGRSTAAAVAAFCFGERVAILDGNVKRVLTRYLAYEADLSVAANERRLWDLATRMLPDTGGGASTGLVESYTQGVMESYTQGVMDLGATVCQTRSPQCLLCPVQQGCEGRRTGRPERFPVKTRKLKRSARQNAWLWLEWGDSMWLSLRPDEGVWAGLWSLPEYDSPETLTEATTGWPGQGLALPSFTHVLTHLDWTLSPLYWALPENTSRKRVDRITEQLPAGEWVNTTQALEKGLPAPLRKLLLRGLPG